MIPTNVRKYGIEAAPQLPFELVQSGEAAIEYYVVVLRDDQIDLIARRVVELLEERSAGRRIRGTRSPEPVRKKPEPFHIEGMSEAGSRAVQGRPDPSEVPDA